MISSYHLFGRGTRTTGWESLVQLLQKFECEALQDFQRCSGYRIYIRIVLRYPDSTSVSGRISDIFKVQENCVE